MDGNCDTHKRASWGIISRYYLPEMRTHERKLLKDDYYEFAVSGYMTKDDILLVENDHDDESNLILAVNRKPIAD